MMAQVAFVVADDFEDAELEMPQERLRDAGHRVTLVGARRGQAVRGKRGAVVEIDMAGSEVDPRDLDAVVVPGGYSPDRLRLQPDVVNLLRQVARAGRLIAAICHGPSLLIDADLLAGRTVTSWPSIRRDLENAGATWVDEAVVTDGNLVTSRNPGDLTTFSEAILRKLRAQQEISLGGRT
jgi:protease I